MRHNLLAVVVTSLLLVSCVYRPSPFAARPTPTRIPTQVPPITVPGNLITDPSLEGPYHSDGVHPEVNTSYAWKAWYSCGKDTSGCEPPCIPLKDNCCLPCPDNCLKENGKCQSDFGCWWQRMEYNPFNFDKAPYRVHSGNMAQVYFSYGRMALGGIYQTVPITPGTWLRFTAWMQAWQCYEYGPACDWGRKTDKPSNMNLRIGIDPYGGMVVTSTNIVWSSEQEAYDRWVQFVVIAQARASSVTVFTSGGATFDYARSNNDTYLDDLSLVAISPLDKQTFLPLIIR